LCCLGKSLCECLNGRIASTGLLARARFSTVANPSGRSAFNLVFFVEVQPLDAGASIALVLPRMEDSTPTYNIRPIACPKKIGIEDIRLMFVGV
jgi:hypothetical protein